MPSLPSSKTRQEPSSVSRPTPPPPATTGLPRRGSRKNQTKEVTSSKYVFGHVAGGPTIRQKVPFRLSTLEILNYIDDHRRYLSEAPPHQPPDGSIFVYDKRVVKNYKQDGLIWDKKVSHSCGARLLKNKYVLGGCYQDGTGTNNLQRRFYWKRTIDEDRNIVVAHYLGLGQHGRSRKTTKADTESNERSRNINHQDTYDEDAVWEDDSQCIERSLGMFDFQSNTTDTSGQITEHQQNLNNEGNGLQYSLLELGRMLFSDFNSAHNLEDPDVVTCSIESFVPDWGYEYTTSEVLIVGRFKVGNKHGESCQWYCVFGEDEVEAEFMCDLILVCKTPVKGAGMVDAYVKTSHNVVTMCSEVKPFGFRTRQKEKEIYNICSHSTIGASQMGLHHPPPTRISPPIIERASKVFSGQGPAGQLLTFPRKGQPDLKKCTHIVTIQPPYEQMSSTKNAISHHGQGYVQDKGSTKATESSSGLTDSNGQGDNHEEHADMGYGNELRSTLARDTAGEPVIGLPESAAGSTVVSCRIKSFEPAWAYERTTTMVWITGRFINGNQDGEKWLCVFGNDVVEAEFLDESRLYCCTPKKKAGWYVFYVLTSHNGSTVISEVKPFEFRDRQREINNICNRSSIEESQMGLCYPHPTSISPAPMIDPSRERSEQPDGINCPRIVTMQRPAKTEGEKEQTMEVVQSDTDSLSKMG